MASPIRLPNAVVFAGLLWPINGDAVGLQVAGAPGELSDRKAAVHVLTRLGYGRWPRFEPEQLYEGRDLALTADFRDVFAEVLVGHLGVERLDKVFPRYRIDRSKFLGLIG